MLFAIEDFKPNGKLVKRQYIESASPDEARREAGPMPTLRRDTTPLARMLDGRLVPQYRKAESQSF